MTTVAALKYSIEAEPYALEFDPATPVCIDCAR